MQLRFTRPAMACLCLGLLVAACGGGALSLTEYTERLQLIGFTMLAEFGEIETEMESATTVEEGEALLDRAVAIRTDLQNDLTDLNPPEVFVELHADLVTMLGRVLAATQAWAASSETASSLDELQTSSEALTYWNLDADMALLCIELESKLDAIAEREIFADVPWVPGDMKEVVTLAGGCLMP
ncbi:MAG: hypothetical protein ACR2N7_00295 [Acidimicrobiia bacterium]